MSDGSNFPEPKSAADRIVSKATELLDRDEYDWLGSTSVRVRDVEVYVDVDKGWSSVKVPTGAAVDKLKYETPARPFAETLVQSVSAAMARWREKHLVPVANRIENENYRRDKLNRERREWAMKIGLGALALLLLAGGVRACVDSNARAEQARLADLDRVNEFGFRKGDFASNYRLKYPESCQRVTQPYSSLKECRENFARWEKGGGNWIDWNEPRDGGAP